MKALDVLLVLAALAMAVAFVLLLGGCAQKRPRPPAPAPAPISTVEVRRAVAATKTHGLSAQTRVETVIREVEKLQLVTDPATAAELVRIGADLMRANEDLVKLRESVVQADAALAVADKAAADLRAWGISQQQVAAANAEGWRGEECERRRAEGERDKARAVANKRGNLVGLLGAGTLGALALKFVTLAVPWTMLLPLFGGGAGYFLARFVL